jgi:hypothetical protein
MIELAPGQRVGSSTPKPRIDSGHKGKALSVGEDTVSKPAKRCPAAVNSFVETSYVAAMAADDWALVNRHCCCWMPLWPLVCGEDNKW